MMKDSLEVDPPTFIQPQTSNEINELKKNLQKTTNSLTTDDLPIVKKLQQTSSSFHKNRPHFRSTTPELKNNITSFSKSSKNFFRKHFTTNQNLITNMTDDESNPITLRNNFQLALGKLNSNSTKEIAFKQLKEIISKNTTQEALRVYISSLSSYNMNSSINAKEFIVLLYGYIASVYKENLMDPLDKPSNIVKTINRILTHIRNFYLKENSFVVHKACSHSMMEIYENCMPKDNMKGINLLFIEPLFNLIISGNGKYVQEGAAVCLADFIYHLGKDNDTEINMKILATLDTKIMTLFNKHSIDVPHIYEALFNLMQFLPFETFVSYLKEIYDKTITILCKANALKYNAQSKINCLNILSLIAQKCKSVADTTIGYYQNDIMKVIEFNTRDKIHKVQIAANDAYKSWKELSVIYNDLERKKVLMDEGGLKKTKEEYLNNIINNGQQQQQQQKEEEKDVNGEGNNNKGMSSNYVKKMDRFNFLRNLAKMAKIENKKVDFDTELPEKMRDEVYKKGIGNILKLSNFLKYKNNNKNNGSDYVVRRSGSSPKKKKYQSKTEINAFKNYSEQIKKFDNDMNNSNTHKIQNHNNNNIVAKRGLSEVHEVNEGSNVNNNSIGQFEINNKSNNNNNKAEQMMFQEEDIGTGNQSSNPYNNYIPSPEEGIDNDIDNVPQEQEEIPLQESNQEITTNTKQQQLPPSITNKPLIHNTLPKLSQQKHKNQKTYINSQNINPQPQNTNNNINLTQLKNTLSSLITSTLLETYNSFEQKITSSLYDTEQRINDIYLKLEDYQSHPNYMKQQQQHTANNNQMNETQRISTINEERHDYYINNNNSHNNSNVNNNGKNYNYNYNTSQTTNINELNRNQIAESVLNDVKNELSNKHKKNKYNYDNNPQTDNHITELWKEALYAIEHNDYNKGYELILNAGDDIYLLRLVCITGPIFTKLNFTLSKRVLMRVNMISRSHQIQSLLIKLINSALQCNIFNSLTTNEQNDILDSLFEFSGLNTKLGSEAAELYTKITQ